MKKHLLGLAALTAMVAVPTLSHANIAVTGGKDAYRFSNGGWFAQTFTADASQIDQLILYFYKASGSSGSFSSVTIAFHNGATLSDPVISTGNYAVSKGILTVQDPDLSPSSQGWNSLNVPVTAGNVYTIEVRSNDTDLYLAGYGSTDNYSGGQGSTSSGSTVADFDFQVVTSNAVPEAASLGILGVGALMALRRRR